MADNSGVILVHKTLRKSWLHNLCFRKFLASPVFGGRYSYIVEEMDVGKEADCILGQLPTATPEDELIAKNQIRQILDQSLISASGTQGEATDCGLNDENIIALHEYETHNHDSLITGSSRDLMESGTIVSSSRNALAAQARKERDDAVRALLELALLPRVLSKYVEGRLKSIQTQEMRWQQKSTLSFSERLHLWLWILVMQGAVVIPDVVSSLLGTELAVLRSGPITLQTQLMVIAVFDFPWADARLASFLACEVFLGSLPVIIFGCFAIFMSSNGETALRDRKNVAWKATICVIWQISMQNRKNVVDSLIFLYVKVKKIQLRSRELLEEYNKLRASCEIIYSWFDQFDVSNRLRVQISYHKQDHEDVLRLLRWVGKIQDDRRANPKGGKLGVLIAIVAMAALICLSTFPIDPYSGLIAMANLMPLALRAAVNVLDESQSSHDQLRLFTATAGVSFPSTLFMVGNSIYWLIHKKAFFNGFINIRFLLAFVLIFFLSLFPKFWGECFMKFGSKFMKN
nr:C protein [Ipomoea batatas]